MAILKQKLFSAIIMNFPQMFYVRVYSIGIMVLIQEEFELTQVCTLLQAKPASVNSRVRIKELTNKIRKHFKIK